MKLADVCKEAYNLVSEKGWDRENSKKPQTGRNLAISLAIEASELLECFQWADVADKSRVSSEIADIIIFAAQLSNVMGIDLEEAVITKLEVDRNRQW